MRKGNPGGNLNNHIDFSNGANNVSDSSHPISTPAGFMRERGFDFSNAVGGLYWFMDRNYKGLDLGVTQFDGRDLGPREAFALSR